MLHNAVVQNLAMVKRVLANARVREAVHPVDAWRWIDTLRAAPQFAPEIAEEASAAADKLEALFPTRPTGEEPTVPPPAPEITEELPTVPVDPTLVAEAARKMSGEEK